MDDRRRFLHGMAALAAAGTRAGRRVDAADSGPLAEDDGAMPLIDTHVHLWDLHRLRLPWIEPGSPLDRDHLPEDYATAAQGLGVARAVYMEVDIDPARHVAEAEYVIDLCRRRVGPLVAAVVGGRPADEGFPAYLDRFRDRPEVKGVRQVLHGPATPPGTCTAPEFVRGIRLLGERGLSFDLCMRPGELRDAARLVDACPGTSFILDHCGNPSVQAADLSAWREDLSRIAERPNLACKVSGIVASAAPGWRAEDLTPVVDHVLVRFGPDRVVFGGDWPVCTRAATLRQWVEALRAIVDGRGEAERRALFHDNALRVYRLEV
ncbi:amidohydrolase family protein [Tautonia plasticadhaerens]|uniref:Amidohydrolase n=1 Tax=Tautonia plasticadhaerens TaxID=2527974 RepID=A0A518HFG8_9BACT|nr:amidohydrolase family protein [Tautonia plasticadhaerens]QDV39571.1 Amidohydrolase [Tautonia plasticadhaerens]